MYASFIYKNSWKESIILVRRFIVKKLDQNANKLSIVFIWIVDGRNSQVNLQKPNYFMINMQIWWIRLFKFLWKMLTRRNLKVVGKTRKIDDLTLGCACKVYLHWDVFWKLIFVLV